MNRLWLSLTFLAITFFAIAATSSANAKTLRMAYDADPVSLDPHEQLSSATLQLSHLVFDPLIRWRQDYSFEARLAERWEKVDEVTTRFYLRKGVLFHSGRELGAKDVVWTFDRLKLSPDFKGLYAPFKSAVLVDDYTVDIVTHKPYPLVLNMMTYLFPMDSEFYKDKPEIVKHGDSFASKNMSGTGPFILTKREQGVRLEFSRFGKYWDKETPGNVTEIVFTPIKEAQTRVAALLAQDVDFISPVPPADLDRVKNDPGTHLVTKQGTRIVTFQLNQQRVPQFKDARVRQAIVHAVNNVGIARKIMKGFATPAGQMSPFGYVGHDPALVPRYDLKLARTLMKLAGHEKGFSVTMMAPSNRYVSDYKIAQAVAAMLAKINIKVELKTLPKAQYWPKFDERAADIMMIGWHSDTEDSANFSEFLIMTPDKETGFGQYNSGNYSNDEIDKLVIESQSELDPAKRAEILKKVERLAYEDAAFIPLHWQHLAWGARKGVDIGKVINVMDMPQLGDLVID